MTSSPHISAAGAALAGVALASASRQGRATSARPQAVHAARTAAGVALLVSALAAGAQATDARRPLVEQRIRLAERLIEDPAAAQRVTASGSTRAIAHFDEGRVHLQAAQAALASGDLASALAAADEALKHVGHARRMAPDAASRQAAAQQRYLQQQGALDRLLQAWSMRAQEAGRASRADDDRVAAESLMADARGQADAGRYEDASRVLGVAEQHVLAGMNRLLHQRTLDYSARPSTPAQAYADELARLDALHELVPLAVAELRPRAEAAALVERYRESSTALRAQAMQTYADGRVPQAMDHLRSAVLYAQRALQAAGLSLPAATDEPR